jgi:hypothetical protein
MRELALRIAETSGTQTPVTIAIEEVLLAGYTGRDRTAVLEHIRELEKIGVAPPPSVPMVYVVDAALLTTGTTIDAGGPDTSGEIEVCFVFQRDDLLVGLGSDHTDRKQEAIDIAVSKTLCHKPISSAFWRYSDLKDHWESIEIRSWSTEQGSRRLYQEGTLAEFMAVSDLLDEVKCLGHDELGGRFIFSGTVPTQGGLACGERFEAELRDRFLGRRLEIGYDIRVRTQE